MVTVPELAAALAGSAPPALLDVRWTLGEVPGSGRQRYAAGHLPGAAFLDLESALTRHTGDPRDGRHPLPDLAVLRRRAR
jgi:thiosulfate/3-mercaptopyruvate sulfurtransferase